MKFYWFFFSNLQSSSIEQISQHLSLSRNTHLGAAFFHHGFVQVSLIHESLNQEKAGQRNVSRSLVPWAFHSRIHVVLVYGMISCNKRNQQTAWLSIDCFKPAVCPLTNHGPHFCVRGELISARQGRVTNIGTVATSTSFFFKKKGGKKQH